MEDTHVLDSLKVSSYPQSYGHTVFIDESIAETTYYRSVISILNSAQENDSIQMIIDTNGGLGSTAMTLTHAMDSCKAKITGVLSGNCKSAGTIIALHCHDWEIGHGLDWLAHTASFGIGGEANKVAKWHDHEQKLIHDLLFREYEGFYTKEEIDEIAEGNDSMLTPVEVGERLEKFSIHKASLQDKYHQEIEDAMWNENNVMVEEAISSLDISQSDKDTFNRVKDLLDKEMMMESSEAEPSDSCCSLPEGTPLSDFPSVIEPIYAWTEDISVEAFNYPEDPLFLFDVNVVMELELKLSSMIDQREEVIHFLAVVTGKKPSRKKATTTLALELIALATKFIIEVEK